MTQPPQTELTDEQRVRRTLTDAAAYACTPASMFLPLLAFDRIISTVPRTLAADTGGHSLAEDSTLTSGAPLDGGEATPRVEIRSMRSAEPSNEELYEIITPLWKGCPISLEAQSIRAQISTSVDSGKYEQWILDYVPDYVWPLIDIAAQKGLNARFVPTGFKVVPIEPTNEMIHQATLKFIRENGGLEGSISEIYKAMIAAAPDRKEPA